MPRSGITYEQVRDAADSLKTNNTLPTIRKIRKIIGTGSEGTIQRHLLRYRQEEEGQGMVAVDTKVMSGTHCIDNMGSTIARAVMTVKNEYDEKLAAALDDAAVLAETCEKLESEKEALKTLLQDSTAINTSLRKIIQSKSDELTVAELRIATLTARLDEQRIINSKIYTQLSQSCAVSVTSDHETTCIEPQDTVIESPFIEPEQQVLP